ncbi:MAG: cyclic nucleotide-binding domain-containing protein, partial [Sphaerochaeta sp.]
MDLVRILSSATLFKGIEEQEIGQLLPCVEGRTSDFPRDYTIIDEGQYTEELGIVLSGAAHIVRHDFWGNRSLVANVGVAQSFAEALACVNLPSEVSVITVEPTKILFLNAHKLITTCEKGCPFHNVLIDNMVRLLSLKNLELMKKITH